MNATLCYKLKLKHSNGDILYPARMVNRDTGRVAFRLSKGGNTKSDSIEIEEEDEMIKLVTKRGYRVRARTEKPASQGGRTGLYAIDERAIISWQIVTG